MEFVSQEWTNVWNDIDTSGYPKLTEDQKTNLRLLECAIRLFYKYDASDLWGGVHAIDERAMVGCVYRYMYCFVMSGLCPLECSDIDIEYDRMNGENGDEIRKCLGVLPSRCEQCFIVDDCMALIKKVRERQSKKRCCGDVGMRDECNVCENACYRIRPDIIVHKRKSDRNGLVVEFKKKCEGRDVKARESFDKAKLRASVCSFNCLKYQLGVFVSLKKDCATLEVFLADRILDKNRTPFIVEVSACADSPARGISLSSASVFNPNER